MLKHRFAQICYNLDELLDGCNKLSTFMTRLRKQSRSRIEFEADSYFGDGFEVLVESLILQMGHTPWIQMRDYVPVQENDLGVDGYGYGIDGEIHTVQIKARSNSQSVLTANKDHISNFVAHSHSKYGGESKVKHMTLFTTAADLHRVAREMYGEEVNVIAERDLKKLLDGNKMFWATFREQMQKSYVQD